MTQNITIQIGQCGNQIGCRFWDLALREHSNLNKKGIYDEALSTFFRNVDIKSTSGAYSNEKSKDQEQIRSLKARAVLIDSEEGVVNEVMNGPLKEVFEHRQYITDVSGAGNNWAEGHMYYGQKYNNHIRDLVRQNAEHCDSLESFFIMHSMGGGTGSGLGTAVLKMLADEFEDVHRFVVAVYPSADDDVITSPYNSVLAQRMLTDYADCVIPIDNQSLVNIVNKVESSSSNSSKSFVSNARNNKTDPSKIVQTGGNIISSQNTTHGQKNTEKPFDSMNNIVANMLLNLTSSSRFEGSLNVDLNEITMNLVPFPRMHYLISSLSPLYINEQVSQSVRGIEQMFSDSLRPENQLLQCNPKGSLYLSYALLLRGNCQISDIRRNIEKLKSQLNFISWNTEGWKTGLCSVAPFGQPYSLLGLANNTCIVDTFSVIRERFHKLYRRKAHLHHYTQVDGMDLSLFNEAEQSLLDLMSDYKNMEKEQLGVSNPTTNSNEGSKGFIGRIKVLA